MTTKKNRIVVFSILLVSMVVLGYSCKDKPQPAKPEPKPVAKTVEKLSPAYQEIASFMGLEASDTTQIENLLDFKVFTDGDSIVGSNAAENLKYYKDIFKKGTAAALPIFEAKESDLTLLLFAGRGYVGAIWAEVLIDRSTGKTVKVRFGHKMESEGYGDGMVAPEFEEQFANKDITFSTNTFALAQNGTTMVEGASQVDGVSGATATSTAVVQMLNTSLQKLQGYLSP